MAIINVKSSEEFNNCIQSEKLTLALFSAEFAEQCKQVLDAMTELSNQSKSMQLLNVPAEDLSEISIKHQIEAVPTVILFKNGSAVDRIDGVNIPALTQKCKKFVETEKTNQATLESRLKALINQSTIMIFMKGNRDEPKCGFSKQLIALINSYNLAYETFDILSDEEVRQGLKLYSDWPTYPQLYVNGELIGGLDIIKEMHASGDLVATLNGS